MPALSRNWLGPDGLEQFQLVLLYRPPDAPDYNEATLTALQRDHIEFYGGLREAGHVVTKGPVLDPPDPRLRGLDFFTVESLGRAGSDRQRPADQSRADRAARHGVVLSTRDNGRARHDGHNLSRGDGSPLLQGCRVQIRQMRSRTRFAAEPEPLAARGEALGSGRAPIPIGHLSARVRRTRRPRSRPGIGECVFRTAPAGVPIAEHPADARDLTWPVPRTAATICRWRRMS
jgi:uncharacterized protein